MTRRAALLAPFVLAACGFAPAYAPGGPGERLRGRIAVKAPDTPEGFRLRAALEERLGAPGSGSATLTVTPRLTASRSGRLPGAGSVRERLDGRAAWQLVGADGGLLAQDEAQGFTGSTVTGPAVSVRTAESDARERLLSLLADRIVAQLLLLPPEALP